MFVCCCIDGDDSVRQSKSYTIFLYDVAHAVLGVPVPGTSTGGPIVWPPVPVPGIIFDDRFCADNSIFYPFGCVASYMWYTMKPTVPTGIYCIPGSYDRTGSEVSYSKYSAIPYIPNL